MISLTKTCIKRRTALLLCRTAVVFSLFVYFTSFTLFAQENEGRIRYMVNENITRQIAAINYMSPQQRESIHYISSDGNGWNSYMEMYFTPDKTHYIQSEERANKGDAGYSWRKEDFFIHRDLAKGRMTDQIKFLDKMYIIDDELKLPKWKILNDIKDVAGHICMNAFREDTLRQQKIIAWFALDMPISGGPDNLCGLPGMILEADVNDGGMVITADKIDLMKLTDQAELPAKIKGKKIKKIAYDVLIQKYFEEKRKAQEFPFFSIRYL
jgi:GLPGLI family protein